MFPYITLNDDTEITHSEVKPDGRVKVYIETPDAADGFHSAVCWLPDYTLENVQGYSESEMAHHRRLGHNNAHLILEYARDRGILSATTV